MNKRFTARMLSRFKNGLDSWISLWHFLVHLDNLNFYEGLDGCETERTRSVGRGSGLYAAIEERSGREPSGTARAAASHGRFGREDDVQPRTGVRLKDKSIGFSTPLFNRYGCVERVGR
jgi:hypothetical protein